MSTETRLTNVEADLRHVKEKVDGMDKKLDNVLETQAKQKGFIAGVVSAVTAFWAFVVTGIAAIWHVVRGS